MIEQVPARPEDADFLLELYASTRREEVAAWGWEKGQQDAFLQMQFQAQSRSYQLQFPGADHCILLHEGELIGRLLVHRTDQEIRLVDIALLPAFRGQGHGGAIICDLQAEAAAGGKPLRLSVLPQSPARRLYERLGFTVTAEDNQHCAMTWQSPN